MSVPVSNHAVDAFHEIERNRRAAGLIPPVARLGVTVAFLVSLSSLGKYDLTLALAFSAYPLFLVFFERVPLLAGIVRFWYFLVPVLLLGAANPFFDRVTAAHIAGMPVSGGWMSFAVLSIKGTLSLFVTWALVRRTGMDGIAEAFAALRLPNALGTAVLLMHRYLVLIIKECERMKDSYLLRSGGKTRAIRPSSWGPFAGLLLMRSMDRAADVQAAVELRGGCGGMRRPAQVGRSFGRTLAGTAYFAGWTLCFADVRFFDPVRCAGDIVRKVFA